MSKILEFSELLMTKFCHDIAGPIGAVNNGIEFLEEPDHGGIRDKAMELISKNGKEAAAKLKFFRYIYGVSQSSGEADIHEIQELAKEFFNDTPIKLNWIPNSSAGEFVQLTHRACKLLMNMLYCSSSVLIAGGEIEIQIVKIEKGKSLILKSKGSKIKEIDDLVHILNNHELRDIKLNNVQIHHTAKIASSMNVVIECAFKSNELFMKVDFV